MNSDMKAFKKGLHKWPIPKRFSYRLKIIKINNLYNISHFSRVHNISSLVHFMLNKLKIVRF